MIFFVLKLINIHTQEHWVDGFLKAVNFSDKIHQVISERERVCAYANACVRDCASALIKLMQKQINAD